MPRHGLAFPRQSSGLIHGAARGVRNAFKSRAELQREADRRRVDVCIEELLSVVDSPPGTEVNLDERIFQSKILDADDARCQPTPAPVPAPHHSDGATALAAGLAVPALAALAL